MNDDTLTTALDRMATALAPPAQADELVAATRTRIRHRRRIATGLGAASVVGVATVTATLAGNLAGAAGPALEQAPMASAATTPTASTATTGTTNSKIAVECTAAGNGRITMPEALEKLENEVPPPGSLLSLDLEGDRPRAWLRRPDGTPLLELELRKRGDEYAVHSATRCAG